MLSHSILLEQYVVVLGSSILGGVAISITVQKNASPCLILEWNPRDLVAFRFMLILLDSKSFDLGIRIIPTILLIQVLQEVPPLFMGKVAVVPILVFHMILNLLIYTVLGFNVDLILRELVVTDSPILLVKHVSLI